MWLSGRMHIEERLLLCLVLGCIEQYFGGIKNEVFF